VWLQYLLGLRRLGHEVYFLEDCGDVPYVYNFDRMEASNDVRKAAAQIETFLTPFGFGDRWVYLAGDVCLGLRRDDWLQICHEADVLIALPTSLWTWRPEYTAVPRRFFLDVDPGFSQFRAVRGDVLIRRTLTHCTHFFTYGPAIGSASSPIPTLGLTWHTTRPPVVLEQWPVHYSPGARFLTTLMQWGQDPSPEYVGESYGQKDVEFRRIVDLPRQTAQPMEVALSGGPAEFLAAHGWHVVPGWVPSRDPRTYRDYIQAARGEFSVAKNGYVKTGCGWISDRTTCFLATGKPAIVQETGLTRWLPVGSGLLTFRDCSEALGAIDAVNRDYPHHCSAARWIAEEYFDSDLVLTQLLDSAECSQPQTFSSTVS
jgi:hypothetical protein